jgi:MinD superfamily P-loop ATPase
MTALTVAIASGKGGTGKTTVALNLALCAEGPVTLLDCDVEEPNSFLFFPGDPGRPEPAYRLKPVINPQYCTGCGACAAFCHFNALACVRGKVVTFPELCHACGGCVRVCRQGAISEENHEMGTVETRSHKEVTLVTGRLKVGEASAGTLIEVVRAKSDSGGLTLIDAPPGTSCSMVAAVRGADYSVLVTEPTPFGLHDLRLAAETAKVLGVPFGVVINRAGSGDDRVQHWCAREGIPLLAELPDDREVAVAYSKGIPASEVSVEWRARFVGLLECIRKAVMESNDRAAASA